MASAATLLAQIVSEPYHRRMPKPTFAEGLEALAALREPIRRRRYQRVLDDAEALGRDPETVHLEIDVYWAARAGVDPVTLLGWDYLTQYGRTRQAT